MTVILEPPIVQTPEALVQIAVERLQETYPNFNPNPADPMYQLFFAVAIMVAEAMLLAIDVPEEIIRFVGEVVYQIAPEAAVAATGITTWEALDLLGHTVPVGTAVLIEPEGETPVAFETTNEVTIAPGASATIGTVHIRAQEAGEAGNVTGTPKVAPNELLTWVKAVSVTQLPSGGIDEEAVEEYAARVLELARIIKPEPILPEDFANFARLLIPGLKTARILAVDLLQMTKNYPEGPYVAGANEKPNTAEVASNVERCVTIIPVLESGLEPTEAVCKEAWELLESRREASFKVFVASPTYTSIAVTVTGTVLTGYDKEGTEAQVKATLEEFLSPGSWGRPTTTLQTGWVQHKNLYFQDVVTTVSGVPGFGHYTDLKVNGATADIVLAGVAPLTKAGSITVTLSESAE